MEVVVKEETQERIDKYLTDATELSRSLITKMLKDGAVLVNGSSVKPSYNVKVNDIIKVDDYQEDINIEPENIPLDIVYEDSDVIVVNKKSGMVVHPGNGNSSGTLVNALMYHTNKLSDINGEIRPGIVHRIDKDTSGLMLVAKNNQAHNILAEDFSKKLVHREYIALLKGVLKENSNTIDAPIGRDKLDRKKMAVTEENSKSAITHMQVIKRYKNHTLVRCKLDTGRTHQIRVHAKYINHPIYNDPVYTNDKCTSFGQFLHSCSLDFTHPITKEQMHFEVDLPNEFKLKLDELDEIN